MPQVKNIAGLSFGRLTALSYLGQSMWRCQCSCGATSIANASNLCNGHTRSCGCLRVEARTKHGMSRTPEFEAWANMTGRCLNPRHPNYPNYGGRGISLFRGWRGRGGFSAFVSHIGARPSGHLSVERIDNERGYEPGNVRWATRKEQARNTRGNHWVEIDGRRQILSDWAIERDIDITTIIHRMERGMSPRDAVMKPPREGGRRTSKNRKRRKDANLLDGLTTYGLEL